MGRREKARVLLLGSLVGERISRREMAWLDVFRDWEWIAA